MTICYYFYLVRLRYNNTLYDSQSDHAPSGNRQPASRSSSGCSVFNSIYVHSQVESDVVVLDSRRPKQNGHDNGLQHVFPHP
jgi:hypothetical protein